MNYSNLQDLIQNSRSSRAFFLSLPVKHQMQLHEYNDYITTAQKLHDMANYINKENF